MAKFVVIFWTDLYIMEQCTMQHRNSNLIVLLVHYQCDQATLTFSGALTAILSDYKLQKIPIIHTQQYPTS